MSNKLVSTLLIGCLGVLLFSCDKDGDTIYKTDPTEQQASTAPLVTVIYDAEGVGDLSYNDLIANVHLLTGSEKVRSLHSDDGFSMTDGGTFDEDDR